MGSRHPLYHDRMGVMGGVSPAHPVCSVGEECLVALGVLSSYEKLVLFV